MKFTALFLLLAGSAFASHAQTTTSADSLRRRGELTGSRPSGNSPARPRPAMAARRPASLSDPLQQHLLGTDINLTQAVASQIPDLYEAFISTIREERRKWSYADWEGASQVLARLNQRYEQVRTALPLEERLRIRSFQGEFHTLRGAREVKDKLE